MNNNIFEGVKFGDKFLTRNHQIVIFLRSFEHLGIKCNYVSTGNFEYEVDNDGKENRSIYSHGTDIVSRYQEPIDEDKLDELAENWNINYALHPHMEDYEEYNIEDVVEAFKYGYRKAMEE